MQVHFSSLDPSLVYVGAQVAARRSELDISQRTLAANQIINAGTLIAFEKGRSWPRAKTREKLEEALGWPPGRIESLRRQHAGELQRGAQTTAVAAAPPADDGERTVMLGAGETTAVESRYMAETIAVALSNIRSQVAALPAVTDPGFQSAAAGLLADLGRLESAASNASRGAAGAQDIFRELSAVRRARRDLMLHAAASPHATIGQRVFAARHRAELTVEEAAAMVGISPHDVTAAESGTAVPDTQAGVLNRLLAALQ
ncbi:hypothetical protein A7U43_28480 (plasmid) [Mycobacterium adipatum]|uniref:HTH cro/C1-type domain-containing protein n=1 Tax=Mycobacterium adipatum TaxID=1682113 RepID=A0A172UXG9_9MYCO|nr:hypothetical protein A7U43_28480 [Mycobacterium adipatum]